MLKFILLFSILVAVAFSEEEARSRERRFSPFGFGFPFTYAGPGGAFAGAGAGAGFGPYGYGPSPWFQPRVPSYFPFNWAPFPFFPFPQNWYEGENVCKEVKTRNDDTPDEFNEWLKEDESPNVNSDYSHEQEQCKGSNTKFVCIKRIVDNGKARLQATKYECCHGFVRNPNGPGCIESVGKVPSQ
ncbi:hypothetical protein JTE90_024908 [Oedothorax gibbosus]|uniref:Uncharacterized protein n=1 Tax=Oedothorax gibbosus TaxID=931172 RepID=A0AAV6U3V7_9ARAC|nr:hypothetical protein JTE90_024908 [Oedothorax gibbosus]